MNSFIIIINLFLIEINEWHNFLTKVLDVRKILHWVSMHF